MERLVDEIAVISPEREKYFGCSGKMLLPSVATVEAMIRRIPQRKLITVDGLRRALAAQFNVEVTCPAATQQALRAIAKRPAGGVAYWRVVKRNGELISIFPGGVAGHAARLGSEGLDVDTRGKAPRVAAFADRLVALRGPDTLAD